jgi:hypothetical protein
MESASAAFSRRCEMAVQAAARKDVSPRALPQKHARHMKQVCDMSAWAGLSEADGLAEKIASRGN